MLAVLSCGNLALGQIASGENAKSGKPEFSIKVMTLEHAVAEDLQRIVKLESDVERLNSRLRGLGRATGVGGTRSAAPRPPASSSSRSDVGKSDVGKSDVGTPKTAIAGTPIKVENSGPLATSMRITRRVGD